MLVNSIPPYRILNHVSCHDIYNITIIHVQVIWVKIFRAKITMVTYSDTQQLGCHGTDMEGGEWFVYVPVL